MATSNARTLSCAVVTAAATFVAATIATSPARSDENLRYTFSWPFAKDDAMRPRGGTTSGPPVEVVEEPSEAWQALTEPGLDAFERDRRAILAMTGEFRTTFDFIETVGFTPDFEPSRPYQSWATEVVFPLEDRGDFISLQHVIVMRYVDESGDVHGPVVQKHWRQDWQYEDPTINVYAGHGRFDRVALSEQDVRGTWSQTVYQVDDSPRYAAVGKWAHGAGYSAWTSDETWRPLPRRESTVRDDYDVLIGTNRHTITPTGWVQEEDNLKVTLDAQGRPAQALAREIGLNRYERITGFDFSAADGYWTRTADFWSDVREAWAEILEHETVLLKDEVDGQELFVPMFEYAAALDAGEPYDPQASRRFVRATLDRYVEPR